MNNNPYNNPYQNPQNHFQGQPPYGQPYPPFRSGMPSMQSDMSVGDWVITFILMCIPIVSLILLLVWAFGSGAEKPSRKTWARATLIFMVIAFVLTTIMSTVAGISLFSMMNAASSL